jgi:hypothetical protein
MFGGGSRRCRSSDPPHRDATAGAFEHAGSVVDVGAETCAQRSTNGSRRGGRRRALSRPSTHPHARRHLFTVGRISIVLRRPLGRKLDISTNGALSQALTHAMPICTAARFAIERPRRPARRRDPLRTRAVAGALLAMAPDGRLPRRQRNGATHVGGSTKGVVQRRHCGRAHVGEFESWRTPLRASDHGVADLCFGDACLPESCKHRMARIWRGAEARLRCVLRSSSGNN